MPISRFVNALRMLTTANLSHYFMLRQAYEQFSRTGLTYILKSCSLISFSRKTICNNRTILSAFATGVIECSEKLKVQDWLGPKSRYHFPMGMNWLPVFDFPFSRGVLVTQSAASFDWKLYCPFAGSSVGILGLGLFRRISSLGPGTARATIRTSFTY